MLSNKTLPGKTQHVPTHSRWGTQDTPKYGYKQHSIWLTNRFTYRGRNDSKIAVTAKPITAGVTACKPENLEHNAQPVGSLTGWAVCFPGGSAGLNLPGGSSGFHNFHEVGLGSVLFLKLSFSWFERRDS